ncbi:hypothetical protein STIUS_v1c03720 [Spiroplasma sp. TIUS-1]|uniref:hypothetical protein n=1 Tax=Spiroplasma sp. TIUS-1 TaxID=216963 RepID=UPI0013972A24|nr:hypothetical protein [Spiroplasma sp. TIUS-1]QHX35926.1 hypothetical protein STIUS_v1c03720 [Spiroplasma sp. TIUS-1]
MAGFSPRFCTIHLKIHVCPDTGVTTKLKAQEDAISYKIRRLHGNQTEDDKVIEQEKQKRGMKEGTISALLAKAKATNAKQREETGINDDDMEHGPLVSEENISDRMARLRSKALGESTPEPKNAVADDIKDTPVTMAVRKNSKPTPTTITEEEFSKPKPKPVLKDKVEEDENQEDIHEAVYSTAEVSQMITDAVELALSKYIKATTKAPQTKKSTTAKKTTSVKKSTTTKAPQTKKSTTAKKPTNKK